jgi:AcrB/AcrD/AcrF family
MVELEHEAPMIAPSAPRARRRLFCFEGSSPGTAGGVPLDAAIEQAGEVRFLPILLTSLTAIGGLTPLALHGSGIYSPLAIVIIGGLLSSTLLAGARDAHDVQAVAAAGREARGNGASDQPILVGARFDRPMQRPFPKPQSGRSL